MVAMDEASGPRCKGGIQVSTVTFHTAVAKMTQIARNKDSDPD